MIYTLSGRTSVVVLGLGWEAQAPSFMATHDFFANITQIFYFFVVPNCTKFGKFAASIEHPNTISASALGGLSPPVPLTRGTGGLSNTLLRILQSAPRKAPVSDLYENFNTLNIPDLHNFQRLVLIHKFFYHKENLPVIFTSYFNANFFCHNHDTRNRDNLHLARCKTSYGLKCIKYKGSNLWNQLPSELKLITSINSFKCKLKSYIRALS